MRTYILFLVGLALTANNWAQSDLDKQFPVVGQDLSNSIDGYIQKKGWTGAKVGLINFENSDGNISQLGIFLSNELVSWVALGANERFSVVSSNDIEKIINEKERVTKYRTYEDKVVLLNKYKIVDAIIVGTLTKFNDGYRLNLKVLSTNPVNVGTVIAIKIVTLNRTADFDKMFDSISAKKDGDTKPEPRPEPKPEPKPESSNVGKVVEALMTGSLTRDQQYNATTVCKYEGKIYVIHSIPGMAGNDIELDALRYAVYIIFSIDKEGSGKYISHRKGDARW